MFPRGAPTRGLLGTFELDGERPFVLLVDRDGDLLERDRVSRRVLSVATNVRRLVQKRRVGELLELPIRRRQGDLTLL
jgi:hypothetical protein